jgi:MscS family membrane protein
LVFLTQLSIEMNEFLNSELLDNTVLRYLICFGAILLAFLFKRFLSKYIAGLFFKLVQKASWNIDKKVFVDLMVQPLDNFVFVLVTLGALDKLKFPTVLDFEVFRTTSRKIMDSVVNAAIIILFIWLLLRIIDFIALVIKRRAGNDNEPSHSQIIIFFGDFFKVVIIIIGVLLLIQFAFHKDISAWLGGVGIATAAIALAAKESLENFIASFIIFFNKPFHLGDLVKVNGVTGNIEKIGLRSTRIRTDQKTYVTVPNKQMVDTIVDNLSLRTYRRADLKLEISLGTTSIQLNQLVEGIRKILQHSDILSGTVLLSDIASNAFIINVEYYCNPIPVADFNAVKQHCNLQIVGLIESLNIELAGHNTEVRLRTESNIPIAK